MLAFGLLKPQEISVGNFNMCPYKARVEFYVGILGSQRAGIPTNTEDFNLSNKILKSDDL
jgi:hypothetical protein